MDLLFLDFKLNTMKIDSNKVAFYFLMGVMALALLTGFVTLIANLL